MRARDFRLAPMSRRRFFGILGTMLGVCVVSGVGMRMSLTDVNAGRPALDDIDFRVRPGTEGMIGLYNSGQVLEELERDGLTLDDYTLEEAADRYTMAMDNVEEIAPVMAVGTFTGQRTYVYQALREQVRVTSVLKGEGLAAGETVDVLEGYVVKEGSLTSTGDNGQFSSDRIITASIGDYGAGNAPMREGQEYLLFLEPKRYPAEWAEQVPAKTYCLANHPYARIVVDIGEAEAAERVEVVRMEDLETEQVGQITVTRMPRLPLRDAVEKDIYVQTDRARDMYLLTARAILGRVLGG